MQGIVVAMGIALGAGLSWAAAATAAPAWRIDALSNTTAAPGGTLDYLVQVTNVGDASSDGNPLELVATLPPDVRAVSAANASTGASFSCGGPSGTAVAGASTVTCTETGVVPADDYRVVRLTVEIAPDAAGSVRSSFQVSGGGGGSASTVDPTTLRFSPPGFGVDAFDTQISTADGELFAQAAGHPFAVTTAIDLITRTDPDPPGEPLWQAEPVKDVVVDLPPGLIANPTPAAQCSALQLENATGGEPEPLCAPSSQVGTALVRRNDLPGPVVLGPLPVFNLTPAAGELARFGFNVAGTVVTLDAQLRSESDHGLTLHAAEVPQGLQAAGLSLTLWGVPADPSHDAARACPGQHNPWRGGPTCPSGSPRTTFLRTPTSCSAAGVQTMLSADSWTHQGVFASATVASHDLPGYPSPPFQWGPMLGMTGCDVVPFDPTVMAAPASNPQAGQPAAFSFDVALPQTADPDIPVTQADLRWLGMTLPEGLRVSPVGENGLAGCSSAQIALGTAAPPACPNASQIGTATIATPLRPQPLTGAVYLAAPGDNPFDSELAIYVVAAGPGLIVKLPWELEEDPDTGELTAVSDDLPQLPLSNLHIELSGGPHAWMTLPNACGTFTTYALAASWSRRVSAWASSFEVSEGAGGGPCPTPPPPPPPDPGGTPGPVTVPPATTAPSRSVPQAGVTSVGRARVRDGVVLVPLACSDRGGCSIVATLTVLEQVRDGRVVSVAVRRRRGRSEVVVVGRASTSLAAGQRTTLRVGLNRVGRRLLRRLGQLSPRLRIAQDGKTVQRRRVTLR